MMTGLASSCPSTVWLIFYAILTTSIIVVIAMSWRVTTPPSSSILYSSLTTKTGDRLEVDVLEGSCPDRLVLLVDDADLRVGDSDLGVDGDIVTWKSVLGILARSSNDNQVPTLVSYRVGSANDDINHSQNIETIIRHFVSTSSCDDTANVDNDSEVSPRKRVSIASIGDRGSSIARSYVASPLRTFHLETLYLFDLEPRVDTDTVSQWKDAFDSTTKPVDSVYVSSVDCDHDNDNDDTNTKSNTTVFELYSTMRHILGNANVVLDVKGCGDTIEPAGVARELLA